MTRRLASLALVLSVVSAVVIPAATASAQEDDDQRFGMTVAPVRVFVDGGPGERSETFRVLNDGANAIDVVATVDGDDGAWVRLEPARFRIEPKRVQEVRATLRVPDGAPPGDHNLTVTFTAKGKPSPSAATIDRAIGALFVVTVPGEARRKITLGEIRAPSITDVTPVGIRLEVNNEGNVRRDFRDEEVLSVRARGRSVATFPETTVLAGKSATLDARWSDPPLFCVCTLRVSTDDGAGNTVSATKRVIVFPFRLALGTLLLAIGLRLLWRARRRRLNALLDAARAQGREEALTRA